MKRYFLTFIFALSLFSGAFAQLSNLIFFTENGERFTVILNGIRQNPNPETNVKVTDLPAPNYKLKYHTSTANFSGYANHYHSNR
jgi:hypothetical protein